MKLSEENAEAIKAIVGERVKMALTSPNHDFSNFQLNTYKSILEKVDSENFFLSSGETICLANLTKERISEINGKFRPHNYKYFVNFSDEIRRELLVNDLLFDVLNEFKKHLSNNFGFDLNFRYRKILEIIEKLKMSRDILISSVNDPYKVCFVYDLDEFFVIELKVSFILEKMNFQKIDDYSTMKESFFSEVSRSNAHDLISGCLSQSYNKDTVEFVLEVLR